MKKLIINAAMVKKGMRDLMLYVLDQQRRLLGKKKAMGDKLSHAPILRLEPEGP